MDKKKTSTYHMLKKLDSDFGSTKSTKRGSNEGSFGNGKKGRARSPPPKETSNKRKSPDILEVLEDNFDYDIPDRSYGDLYCKACDSHMNSEQMWEAHIQGKRHLKQVHKTEPDIKYVDVSLEDPLCLSDIKNAKQVIIGLQHCCELRRPGAKPTYQCFLCSANVPNPQQLIDHVIGMKHRMAYLKEHDPVKHDLISKTELKKGALEPVVEDCVRLHFEKYGHGKMQVKMAKPKPASPYPKKYFKEENDYKKKKVDRKPSPPRKRTPPRDPYYDDIHYRQTSSRDWDSPPRRRMNSYSDRSYPPPEVPYDKSHWFKEVDQFIDKAPSSYRPLSPPHSRPMYDRSPVRKDSYDPVSVRKDSYDPVSVRKDSYDPVSVRRDSYDPVSVRKDTYDPIKPSYTQIPEVSKQEDLRTILDQRKAQEQPASKMNIYDTVMSVINSLPDMIFLEMVLSRVQQMNPADNSLDLIQKIGNHMISIVMNKKMEKLSPEMLTKFKQSVQPAPMPEAPPVAEKMETSLIPNSLKDLISYFKSSSSANETQTSSLLRPPNFLQSSSSENAPAYVTPASGSFFSTSSSTTNIPGLTYTGNVDNQTYNPSQPSGSWGYPNMQY